MQEMAEQSDLTACDRAWEPRLTALQTTVGLVTGLLVGRLIVSSLADGRLLKYRRHHPENYRPTTALDPCQLTTPLVIISQRTH